MPKFVRKAALDRYPEVAGGRSSADWTHVLLTEEEYNELLRKISVAERDVSEAKQRAERAISDAKWEAAQKAQQTRQEAKEQVAAIQGAGAGTGGERPPARPECQFAAGQQRTSQCRSKPEAEKRTVWVCGGKLRGERDWLQGW